MHRGKQEVKDNAALWAPGCWTRRGQCGSKCLSHPAAIVQRYNTEKVLILRTNWEGSYEEFNWKS